MSKNIKENSFDAAGAGTAGAVSTGGTMASPSSPDISQNPDHFEGSNPNKAMGSTSNISKNVIMSPIELKARLKIIMSKKEIPSSDEILSGMTWEMGKMIKKDKAKAKEIVITNIEKTPHYYRDLNQLSSSEDAVTQNITEAVVDLGGRINTLRDGVNIEETKKIFADMFKAREHRYDVDSRIVDVFRETVINK